MVDESTIRLLITKYGDATDDSIVLPRCPPIVVYWGVIVPTGDPLFVQPEIARMSETMTNEYFTLSIFVSLLNGH